MPSLHTVTHENLDRVGGRGIRGVATMSSQPIAAEVASVGRAELWKGSKGFLESSDNHDWLTVRERRLKKKMQRTRRCRRTDGSRPSPVNGTSHVVVLDDI
jgi:hypothetical protein